MKTNQIKFWQNNFGKEYTDRNSFEDNNKWESLYIENWGITRKEMNKSFIGNLNKDIKILEVGSNIGLQLNCLQDMGYNQLYGIEIQDYAVEKSKKYTNKINIIKDSGFDIPFKDGYFDLVFTSGVLIHISPNDINRIIDEIIRCSKKYIWGFEYYSEDYISINYRGNDDVLWKGDFASLFLQRDNNLKIVKKDLFPYINDKEKGNVNCMYLIKKNTNE